jgi:hypothetical protein
MVTSNGFMNTSSSVGLTSPTDPPLKAGFGLLFSSARTIYFPVRLLNTSETKDHERLARAPAQLHGYDKGWRAKGVGVIRCNGLGALAGIQSSLRCRLGLNSICGHGSFLDLEKSLPDRLQKVKT